MNLTTKSHAFLFGIVVAVIVGFLAIDIARSGYKFGRFLAGL